MCDLYVYYRVASVDVPRLRRILSGWPEVRVMRQCDGSAELQTWMEVHSGPMAGRTEAALARSLETLIVGRRLSECFMPANIGMHADQRSDPADHLHVADAGLLERRAALRETGTQVKAHGGQLGVQKHFSIA